MSIKKLAIAILVVLILILLIPKECFITHWENRPTPGIVDGRVMNYQAPLYINELYLEPITNK